MNVTPPSLAPPPLLIVFLAVMGFALGVVTAARMYRAVVASRVPLNHRRHAADLLRQADVIPTDFLVVEASDARLGLTLMMHALGLGGRRG